MLDFDMRQKLLQIKIESHDDNCGHSLLCRLQKYITPFSLKRASISPVAFGGGETPSFNSKNNSRRRLSTSFIAFSAAEGK